MNMFRLTHLSVVGYRSFPDRLDLELRPLTLFYGRNNSGKSAALRLLPILADSLADAATSPFDISRVAGPDASFLDVPTRIGAVRRKQITLELGWTDAAGVYCRDTFELKYIDEADQTIVSRYRGSMSDGMAFEIEALPWPDQATYRITTGGDGAMEQIVQPRFTGLVPADDPAFPTTIRAVRERLLQLRTHIQWLHSGRGCQPRLITKTGRRVDRLEADGANAAGAVVSDRSVFEEVAAWYARPEIARHLEVADAAVGQPFARLRLNPRYGFLRDIDWLDTGDGMIQALPMLAAAAQARAIGESGILAVEAPESQLHANAQQALADHVCQIAAGTHAPTIVLETHSRIWLLSVQLAIAEGRLPPERVRAYWFDQETTGECIATPVEFDRYGRPLSAWAEAWFDEEQALARRLLDRQLRDGAFD